MKKFLLTLLVLTGFQLNSQITIGGGGNSISTNVPTATIFINGEIYGQGSVSGIKIAKNDCIQVDVLADGYIPKSAKFCRQKGLPKMKKSEYFEFLSSVYLQPKLSVFKILLLKFLGCLNIV